MSFVAGDKAVTLPSMSSSSVFFFFYVLVHLPILPIFFFKFLLFLSPSQAAEQQRACLQAWRIAHPPRRGTNWLGTRPLVHVGFLKSWLAGGLKYKVIDHILEAVRQCKLESKSQQPVTVFVTGMQKQVTLRPSFHACLNPSPPPPQSSTW